MLRPDFSRRLVGNRTRQSKEIGRHPRRFSRRRGKWSFQAGRVRLPELGFPEFFERLGERFPLALFSIAAFSLAPQNQLQHCDGNQEESQDQLNAPPSLRFGDGEEILRIYASPVSLKGRVSRIHRRSTNKSSNGDRFFM